MVPSHSGLEVHAAESREALRSIEAVQSHFTWQGELLDGHIDFSHPAFSSWRTAAQMAFAVAFTILGLSLVLASIVAITRA
jgi:hypothetical protein